MAMIRTGRGKGFGSPPGRPRHRAGFPALGRVRLRNPQPAAPPPAIPAMPGGAGDAARRQCAVAGVSSRAWSGRRSCLGRLGRQAPEAVLHGGARDRLPGAAAVPQADGVRRARPPDRNDSVGHVPGVRRGTNGRLRCGRAGGQAGASALVCRLVPVNCSILWTWATASRAASLWVNNSSRSVSSSVTGVIARSV
jgi:hypothetical protein